VLIQRSLIVPALATLALAVVGCSGVGTTATGTTATASSLTAGSASSDVSSPLASLDPCGLLTQDQLTQLGLTLRGPDNPGKSHGCAWQKGPSYEVGIYLNPTQGIKGLNVGGSAKVVLQSHDAIQSASNGFSCVVDIAISEKSSVNVSVASPGGESQECSVAAQYATLIEPKLPAQQK
jgi:hypothetical protein